MQTHDTKNFFYYIALQKSMATLLKTAENKFFVFIARQNRHKTIQKTFFLLMATSPYVFSLIFYGDKNYSSEERNFVLWRRRPTFSMPFFMAKIQNLRNCNSKIALHFLGSFLWRKYKNQKTVTVKSPYKF